MVKTYRGEGEAPTEASVAVPSFLAAPHSWRVANSVPPCCACEAPQGRVSVCGTPRESLQGCGGLLDAEEVLAVVPVSPPLEITEKKLPLPAFPVSELLACAGVDAEAKSALGGAGSLSAPEVTP